jgi:hypothetical protein
MCVWNGLCRGHRSTLEFVLQRVASAIGIFYILSPPVELLYVVDFKQHVVLPAFFYAFAGKVVGNAYEFSAEIASHARNSVL